MAVALLALFIALGGSAYAAEKIRIGSAQIIDNSVRSVDLRNNDVQSADVRDGSLLAADFAPGQLPEPPSAFATFRDSFDLVTGANQSVPVASLAVPAGRYAIFAKLYTGVPISGLSETIRCRLAAGADFDNSIVNHDALIAAVPLSLQVVHEFASDGTIDLSCGHIFTTGHTALGFIKITAIRVASLSNVPSP
jgi:hypothetical protein